MGWCISLALLIGLIFARGFTFTGDVILIASALYAIAGSLGGAAGIVVKNLNKNKQDERDEQSNT